MNLRERANRDRGERYRSRDGRGWSLMKSTCAACGKRCYETRADAKRAGRQAGGGGRVYQCFRHVAPHQPGRGNRREIPGR